MKNSNCPVCEGKGYFEELVCDTVCCKTGWTPEDGCCQEFENGTFWVIHPCEACEAHKEVVEPPYEPPIQEQDYWFDQSQKNQSPNDQ